MPARPPHSRLALILWVCALTAAPAHAALEWTTKSITLQAKVDEHALTAVYPFRNTGSNPVRINAIKTSCGCTTAALAKETYAPGESGEIKVTFTVAGLAGRQDKALEVITDDAPTHPAELLLSVDIPTLLTAEPRLVWWALGSPAEEKVVTIKVHPDAKVALSNLRSTDSAMIRRLDAVGPHEYRLHLQPPDTAKARRVTLLLDVAPENLPPRTLMVFAQVR